MNKFSGGPFQRSFTFQSRINDCFRSIESLFVQAPWSDLVFFIENYCITFRHSFVTDAHGKKLEYLSAFRQVARFSHQCFKKLEFWQCILPKFIAALSGGVPEYLKRMTEIIVGLLNLRMRLLQPLRKSPNVQMMCKKNNQ